jgi:hypothetical protein
MEFAGSRDKVKQREFIDLLKAVGVEDVSPWEDELNSAGLMSDEGKALMYIDRKNYMDQDKQKKKGSLGSALGTLGLDSLSSPSFNEPITSDNASKSVDELFYPGMAENTYEQIRRREGFEDLNNSGSTEDEKREHLQFMRELMQKGQERGW